MSNFRCEVCNTDILEGPGGHYVTGCPHYPLETRIKPENKRETMNNLMLETVKTGIEVTTLFPDENGVTYYGPVNQIGEFSKNHWKWRIVKPETGKDIGLLPTDGKGYHTMHSKDNPHFYYSANPEHIQAAKKFAERKRLQAEVDKREEMDRLKECHSKINDVLREYGATLIPEQTGGDDCGVTFALVLAARKCCMEFDALPAA